MVDKVVDNIIIEKHTATTNQVFYECRVCKGSLATKDNARPHMPGSTQCFNEYNVVAGTY